VRRDDRLSVAIISCQPQRLFELVRTRAPSASEGETEPEVLADDSEQAPITDGSAQSARRT
jgi:hypothetical protein